jgi:hypothetical protein
MSWTHARNGSMERASMSERPSSRAHVDSTTMLYISSGTLVILVISAYLTPVPPSYPPLTRIQYICDQLIGAPITSDHFIDILQTSTQCIFPSLGDHLRELLSAQSQSIPRICFISADSLSLSLAWTTLILIAHILVTT